MMLTRLWRFLMSHIAALVKVGEREIEATLDITVDDAPTAAITVVSPTGQVFAGDTVVVRVDTTPAGGTVESLTLDGGPLTAAEDGTFSFTAVADTPPAA